MYLKRIGLKNNKNGSIQSWGAQQSAQQIGVIAVLLRYGHATVSIISLYLTVINHLFTNTYKTVERIRNPLLCPPELRAQSLVF